ncbi:MAG: HK97 gp10 family phage protein [Paludibacteraceae bacterium]|nr:HK97 gp10 family phage protein [Paludibacteraceae bacterium]
MQTFSSNGITVHFDDRSPEVLEALKNAVERGLMACGEKAVGYAQDKCPVDTGRLRGSIAYKVDGDDCYIGTNVEYAPYIEFGTGKYAETGGRQTPWAFQDKNGEWHMTNGAKPQPFLRPSASDHAKEYTEILKDSLQNA